MPTETPHPYSRLDVPRDEALRPWREELFADARRTRERASEAVKKVA